MDFFYAHPEEVFESGTLQRMLWRGKNGKVQTPRTIVRRLQELAEEGLIKNVGNSRSARYTLSSEAPRKLQVVFKEVDGQTVAVLNRYL